MAKAAAPIRPKKTCCKSGPRCKRCPVVLERLAGQDLARKKSDGRFVLANDLRKKQLKAARAR
jgi:hypothetical protein